MARKEKILVKQPKQKKSPKVEPKKEEVLVLNTPVIDTPIRVDRHSRWASKPSEVIEQRKKMLKTYLENQLEYTYKDVTLVLQLWDMAINSDNIMKLNHCSTAQLYSGLINDNLGIYIR